MNASSLVAPLTSALAVLVAIVFGTLTLRQWYRTRYLTAAAELVRTIQTAEFNRSIARIMELQIDAPASLVEADRDTSAALYAVSHVFEALGVLVYHRLLPLHLVDHLVGGYVRASWKRLRIVVDERRTAVGPTFGEWFQWLAERLDQYPAPGKSLGAPRAFAAWRP